MKLSCLRAAPGSLEGFDTTQLNPLLEFLSQEVRGPSICLFEHGPGALQISGPGTTL